MAALPDIPELVHEFPPSAAERFECLFRSHYRSVLAYAKRRSSADVADDVAADTFLVAWRRLDEVPADAFPWLIGVARLTLLNQRRSGRRERALVIKARALAPVARPVPDFAGDRVVLDALARLPEAECEALTLIVWEGLTPQQAAVALGCSAVAVRVRLHRARRRLAHEFEQERHEALRASNVGLRGETS